MLNKIKGCLFGGAIGDALGYAVEFYDEIEIFATYPKGIQDYKLNRGKAVFSDDTQMTLFTCEGLLMGKEVERNIQKAYLDWYATQVHKTSYHPYTKLYQDKRMHENRAPGMACLNSLSLGGIGTIECPINDSKGCGGVMRVAPIGFCKDIDVGLLASKASAFTHGHPLGYIPSAMHAYLIQSIITQDMSLVDHVYHALNKTNELFKNMPFLDVFNALINQAIDYSKKDINDLDAIHDLGEGWVAEEALAIAVYCALKYENDFKKAIVASVNHKGDSDSIGAITGNILGCFLGFEKLPKQYLMHLECQDILDDISKRLYKKYA